jgi:hypothetical protein
MADRRLTFADVASLLGIVGGAGLFGASAGFASGSLGGGLVPFGEGDNDVATSYPTTRMSVTLGETTNNGELQRATAQKASKMQELNEHNRALTKFLRPGQTPAERIEAIRKGKEAEKKLWSFWADDKPRINYSPSSSAVESIRITPDNRVQVKWRGKPSKNNPSGWYDFLAAADPYQASEAFSALVTAPSIGRAVWPVLTRNVKKPQPNLGWWNMTHFDPSKSPAMK